MSEKTLKLALLSAVFMAFTPGAVLADANRKVGLHVLCYALHFSALDEH